MKREDGTEKRNDEGWIDWGAQHPIGRIADDIAPHFDIFVLV